MVDYATGCCAHAHSPLKNEGVCVSGVAGERESACSMDYQNRYRETVHKEFGATAPAADKDDVCVSIPYLYRTAKYTYTVASNAPYVLIVCACID